MVFFNNLIIIIRKEKKLFFNVLFSFIIKGFGFFISFIMLPIFVYFLEDKLIVGFWFTLVSFINLVNLLDFGLGNGLRNTLTISITKGNLKLAKSQVSSVYSFVLLLSMIIFTCFSLVSIYLPLDSFINSLSVDFSKETVLRVGFLLLFGILIHFNFKTITSIFYSLQLPFFNNLLSLISNVLPVLLLPFLKTSDIETNFIYLALVYIFSINFPYFIASIILFFSKQYSFLSPKFSFNSIKYAFNSIKLGLLFFAAQLSFVLFINLNDILLSFFYGFESVVSLQIYSKVFLFFGSLLSIGITPVWSYVTQEFNFGRTQKLSKLLDFLIIISVLLFFFLLLLIPFLQEIVNFWIGESFISVNFFTGLIFSFYGFSYTLNLVATTFSNGLSKLKIQIIFYSIGFLVKLCFSIFFSQYFQWDILILLSAIIFFIFSFFQIIDNKKSLKFNHENY